MGQGEKRLSDMRRNPRDGWQIEDVRVVCSEFGIELRPPSSGGHFEVTPSLGWQKINPMGIANDTHVIDGPPVPRIGTHLLQTLLSLRHG